MSPDVVIVGAGITGCATAYELSKSGLRVQVIEKYYPASMGSGWTLAGVRQSGRHAAELPLAQYAVEKWRNLDEALGADTGYVQAGNLRLARSEEEVKKVKSLVDSQRRKNLNIILLSNNKQVRDVAPCVSKKILAASFCPTDGHADPYSTVDAFKRAAERQGVTFHTGESVQKLLIRNNQLIGLETSKRRIETPKCLLACGVSINELIEPIGLTIPLSISIATVIQTTRQESLLAPVLGVVDGAVTLRQQRDGRFRLSSGVETWSGKITEINGQPYAFPAISKVQSTLEAGLDICPALEHFQMRSFWGGTIDLTPDALPVLDEAPNAKGLFLASGFSGHGFGIAPASGHILSRLILEQTPDLPIGSFAFNRFDQGSTPQSQATLHG